MSHVTVSTSRSAGHEVAGGQSAADCFRADSSRRRDAHGGDRAAQRVGRGGVCGTQHGAAAGRGRPRHLYKATQAALLLLFANNQRLVVPAIWLAIREAGGEQLTKKILKQVSQSLAEHYSSKLTARKPQERLRQFIDLLMAEGGLIEAVESDDGRLVIYKRSCPFISMVDPERKRLPYRRGDDEHGGGTAGPQDRLSP